MVDSIKTTATSNHNLSSLVNAKIGSPTESGLPAAYVAAYTGSAPSVDVNLSQEAKQALERLDAAHTNMQELFDLAGGGKVSQSAALQLWEISRELDQLLGTNQVQTSESLIYLNASGRQSVTTILDEAVAIYDALNGAAPDEAQQAQLDDLMARIDMALANDGARASHSLASLPPEQQEEALRTMASLMPLVNKANGGGLSSYETQTAADLSNQLDEMFETYGERVAPKELSVAEEAQVEALLSQMEKILNAQGQSGVAERVRSVHANMTQTFLDMLSGRKSVQADEQGEMEALLQSLVPQAPKIDV